jgi:hypothetical protein
MEKGWWSQSNRHGGWDGRNSDELVCTLEARLTAAMVLNIASAEIKYTLAADGSWLA